MAANDHLLDLLLEVQTLDRMPRMGYLLRGVTDPESVSEHTFHTVFLVWALVREEPQLDARRVMELALVHDLAEVRMGDLPRVASRYLPPGVKHRSERAAMRELLAPLGERAMELLSEYQDAVSPEARFVTACDKLQLLIKVAVYEAWGIGGLGEFWNGLDGFDDGDFASIRELVAELRRRLAATPGRGE